jgi:hypothetical protein
VDATELLPCPFCGSKAEYQTGAPGCEWVNCTVCSAETPNDYRANAADNWNRRVDAARDGEAEKAAANWRARAELLAVTAQYAADTFQKYGDMHAAKPDPVKAKRNYDLAAEMRAALIAFAPDARAAAK